MTDAMMKQWRELKDKHPDSILLFRCGDFYEVYGSDATECARILDITATQDARRYVMAGFPHHALDTYLPKLVRAGKRVAICDQIQENHNNEKSETMAENVKAADLIGKTIVSSNGTMKYRVINVDGDKLQVEFVAGDRPAVTMPMPMAQVDKLLEGGWKITDGTDASATASEDVEEVTDIKPEKPKAKTVKMDEPKAQEAKTKTEKPKVKLKTKQPQDKDEPKAKTEKPEAGTARFTYETYTTSKGKTGAKIHGLNESDAAYQMAATIHASGSYTKDKDGNKLCYLCFGPKYAEAAKLVCRAMNEGKGIKELQAITEKPTQPIPASAQPAGKVYTDADVAEILKKIMAGGDIPEDIKKAMAA